MIGLWLNPKVLLLFLSSTYQLVLDLWIVLYQLSLQSFSDSAQYFFFYLLHMFDAYRVPKIVLAIITMSFVLNALPFIYFPAGLHFFCSLFFQ